MPIVRLRQLTTIIIQGILCALVLCCRGIYTQHTSSFSQFNHSSNNYNRTAGAEALGQILNRSISHKTCEWEQLLFVEGEQGKMPVDCCPSVEEITEPENGRSPEGTLVSLYKDGPNIQRFYEISCRNDVVNKPCSFLDRKLHTRSRCVQKYSYSYAIIKDESNYDTNNDEQLFQRQQPAQLPSIFNQQKLIPWKLGYIQIRSGCSCQLKQSNHNYTSLQDIAYTCANKSSKTNNNNNNNNNNSNNNSKERINNSNRNKKMDETEEEIETDEVIKKKRKKHDTANKKKTKINKEEVMYGEV